METILKYNRIAARMGLWFGGFVMLAAAVLIGADILLRVVFNKAIDGADELARFALAFATTWSLAGALLERAHIRVDTAYMRFPRPVQLVCDVGGLIAFLGVFGLIFTFGVELVAQSAQSSARSSSAIQMPMVIPQTIWLCGIALLLVSGLVTLLCSLRLLLVGQSTKAIAYIGIKSADEEVAEELSQQLDASAENNAEGMVK